MPLPRKARDRLELELPSDGWQTPDTYDRHFAALPDKPGVYMFTYKDLDDPSFEMKVVYVGMSSNLRNRHDRHPTRALIAAEAAPLGHIQCWFKTLPRAEVAAAEIELIKKYDPSFNIMHRKRSL